jgi:hypothetical protein
MATLQHGPRTDRHGFLLRVSILLGVAMAGAVWLFLRPPIHQDPTYHNFADQRTLLGVPHFWNVVSNVPFFLLGAGGLWFCARQSTGPAATFTQSIERWPYLVLFSGVALTAFGSAYYHLEPDDGRLMWDRLPMAVAFAGLFGGILAERLGVRAGVISLPILVAAGIGSVLYWRQTGDLRPYYFVQFFPLAGIPLLLCLFPARYTGSGFLLLALAWYIVAKVCEMLADRLIFEHGHWLSGHTLKHLLAAVSIGCILWMVVVRRPVKGVVLSVESAALIEPESRLNV